LKEEQLLRMRRMAYDETCSQERKKRGDKGGEGVNHGPRKHHEFVNYVLLMLE